ncbi:MAG: tetratricopeptide repeat protein [Deltaproteobacteria bacterium]|nr:tetratricopeptide repeat protein [Deltaproteobacteria bacterium]
MTNRGTSAGTVPLQSPLGAAGDADVLVAAASEALSKRSIEHAIALLDGALRLDADHGRAWALLGLARKELGKRTEAIEAYERAISLDAEDEVAPVELAELYVEVGDRERARALLVWLLSTLESATLRRRAEAALRATEGASH